MSMPQISQCMLCPRQCGALRTPTEGNGFCKMPALPAVCRAALHFGEEPCISGTRGSGTVFFCGCTLRCCFCQNEQISRSYCGRPVTVEQLCELFLQLQEQGAHNINLVTATPFADTVIEALRIAKLTVPVVWNTSGYETVETLKALEGLVQIYLPDCKYATRSAAQKYSAAPDYPDVVVPALREMLRQTGAARFDEQGVLQQGVVIRHLMLPGELKETLAVIELLRQTVPPETYISLLRQYTPPAQPASPNLARRVTTYEYEKAVQALLDAGFTNGFTQDKSSATEEYLPIWDLV